MGKGVTPWPCAGSDTAGRFRASHRTGSNLPGCFLESQSTGGDLCRRICGTPIAGSDIRQFVLGTRTTGRGLSKDLLGTEIVAVTEVAGGGGQRGGSGSRQQRGGGVGAGGAAGIQSPPVTGCSRNATRNIPRRSRAGRRGRRSPGIWRTKTGRWRIRHPAGRWPGDTFPCFEDVCTGLEIAERCRGCS